MARESGSRQRAACGQGAAAISPHVCMCLCLCWRSAGEVSQGQWSSHVCSYVCACVCSRPLWGLHRCRQYVAMCRAPSACITANVGPSYAATIWASLDTVLQWGNDHFVGDGCKLVRGLGPSQAAFVQHPSRPNAGDGLCTGVGAARDGTRWVLSNNGFRLRVTDMGVIGVLAEWEIR